VLFEKGDVYLWMDDHGSRKSFFFFDSLIPPSFELKIKQNSLRSIRGPVLSLDHATSPTNSTSFLIYEYVLPFYSSYWTAYLPRRYSPGKGQLQRCRRSSFSASVQLSSYD
jgi:hypothetical protein